jgi:hypothetical protein
MIQKNDEGLGWWSMPAIPASLEAEERGSWFETSPGQVSTIPFVKNKLKADGLEAFACQAGVAVFNL